MKQPHFAIMLTAFLLLLSACDSTEIQQYTLNLVKEGAGTGTVVMLPNNIKCQNSCEASFNAATQVTLSATPNEGSVFVAWGGACSGNATCQVTMDSTKTVTVTFDKKNVPDETAKLSVRKEGTGTVTSAPAGIDCGASCAADFAQGSSVVLGATPGEGYAFGGWAGACSQATGDTCTLTLDADKTVTARFVILGDPVKLTVTKEGAGSGTVSSSPTGISCGSTCEAEFLEGSTVTLTATPAANSSFVGWRGDCDGATCSLSLDSPKNVTAIFALKPALSVSKDGTGSGTVSSSPAGINCGTACQTIFVEGTEVTLNAVAAELSKFIAWGGACSGETGDSCTVTMDTAKSVTATFNELDASELATLTVQKEGVGSGTVTSSPAGISCGGVCEKVFEKGKSVTLNAVPGVDSVFTGWQACTNATGNSCTLTLDSDVTVTASFGRADPSSPLAVSIASSSDDAEEYLSDVNEANPASTVDTDSSDLELTYDDDFGTNQLVGLRFTDIELPENAVISNAVIVFTPKTDSDFFAPTLTIQVEDKAAPETFVEAANNIADRTLSPSSIPWKPGKWTRNKASEATTTPDLSPLLQAISWASGDILFVISGSGGAGSTRRAYSFDDQATRAPKLVITFSSSEPDPDPDPDPDTSFALSVVKAGTGKGSVTSAPEGVECDETCTEATATFEADTEVTLSATPADDSSFTGWGGACEAAVGTTCTLMMDAAKAVNVSFDLTP